MEKLRPGLGKVAASAQAAEELDRSFSKEVIDRRAGSREGRREMFQGAGAMMEMADYAERNGDKEVAPLIANLRSHAMAIRIETAKDVVSHPSDKGRG